MDLGLKDKVAFVAASSQGLGKSVATELALEGAKVVICGRTKSSLYATQDEIANLTKRKPLALVGDVSSRSDRADMIEQTMAHHGVVDILVTNSGGPPSGAFERFELEDWENAYALLLESTVGLIKGFLPAMKAQKSGRILAITSQAVKQPVSGLVLSNSVRASVAGLIKTLAEELGPYNITVNNVMPGYTQTGRLERLLEQNPLLAEAKEEIPLKRFGEPREFAAAVTFLASERASYITGVSLAIDGGWIKNIL